MIDQIALPFLWPAAADERDFIVSDANRAAVRHLEHWSLWPVMATVLTGPRKSGRSLLGRIFVAKTGGSFIDDAEGQDETRLFHAWNEAQSRRKPLLLAAEAPAARWHIRLPDLRSRLLATPHAAIEQPDAVLMGALIEKLLQARSLPAPPAVIGYVVPRIERSYVEIGRVVDALDDTALARRKTISVPIAREALATLGLAEDSYRIVE